MEIKIVNIDQAKFYMKNGVNPVHVEIGYNDRIVFVFTKEETNALFTVWLEQGPEHRAIKEAKAQAYRERHNNH